MKQKHFLLIYTHLWNVPLSPFQSIVFKDYLGWKQYANPSYLCWRGVNYKQPPKGLYMRVRNLISAMNGN